MSKSIWIINQYASDLGMAKRQVKFSNVLTEHGYDVTIVCGSFVHRDGTDLLDKNEKNRLIEVDGAKFLVVKSMPYKGNGVRRILASIKFQKSVMKLAKKMEKPDIVISDFVGLFGNKFLKFKTKYGAQFISDVLDLWPETFVDMGYIKRNSVITKILYKMEHKAYRQADYCMFSFEGGADYIKERGWDRDVDVSKVLYINNGIDKKEYIKQSESNVYEDADLLSDKFKAIYLGSLSEANNPMLIVDAAAELAKTDTNIKILVYGYGSLLNELKDKCKTMGLTNIVFKGRVDIKYAPYILTHGDLNLHNWMDMPLLRFGTSPNKLFMYLASGKPVLSSVHPNYDVLKQYNCGLVVDNDPAEYAKGIEFFANMPEDEYLNYCNNCKMTSNLFDYKYMIENVLLPVLR